MMEKHQVELEDLLKQITADIRIQPIYTGTIYTYSTKEREREREREREI
jgi:hypothetical protein